MRGSFVPHPPASNYTYLREHYVQACGGNACAALMLSVFEGWTIHRLRNHELDGTDLWIYRSVKDLAEQDLCAAFGKDAVKAALDRLLDLGLLERRRNPKVAWDRTWQYRLNADRLFSICGFPPIEDADLRQAIQKDKKKERSARSAVGGTREVRGPSIAALVGD